MKAFINGDHLVLGGQGGDISFLLAVGVPAKNIHVVDRTAGVIERLKKKFEYCTYYMEDVLLTSARLYTTTLKTVNLDFCGTLTSTFVDRVVAIMRLIPKSAIVSMTFLARREADPFVKTWIEHHERESPSVSTSALRTKVLISMLGARNFRCWSGLSYCYLSGSRGAPMTMHTIYLQPDGHPLARPLKKEEVQMLRVDGLHVHDLAIDLYDSGLFSKHIGFVLGIPKMTVAGWLAHEMKKRNGPPTLEWED